jgi:hypothetical protein
MKTLRFIIILFFIAGFAVTNLHAQVPRPVIKIYYTTEVGGQYFECVGEYLWGEVDGELMIMCNTWKIQIKKAVVYGGDEYGNPSGNVYELSQNWTNNWISQGAENTGTLKMNDQIIGVFHMYIHTSTNANKDVIVDKSGMWFNCK